MHETPLNQAAGLIGLAPQSAPRMMAMVCHGDEQAELPLLWRLCWTLADFGYHVTVLDATTGESDSNPGLEQLLDSTCWPASEGSDAPAWTVIPAAKGLQSLCTKPMRKAEHLHRLGEFFPMESVVILYGRSELLVPLLEGSGVEPLLAVSPLKTSLLTSYLALKRLLIHGKLEPTIVNLTVAPKKQAEKPQTTMTGGLSDCAKNFLGYEVNAINIPTSSGEEHTCGAMKRLALRLMESTVLLGPCFANMEGMATPHHNATFDRFAGKH